ncbi:hypothetical protein Tco_1219007 [Tanacetum coccineum]
MDNSRTLKHDGREKVVNSRFSLAHHQAKPRRKHKDDGFLLYNHSHNKYKGLNKDCQLGNPCELPSDLTANNEDPIIEKILECHVGSTREAGFCTNCSHKTSTNITSWIASLAIRVRSKSDPRAQNHSLMIEDLYGCDSKERVMQGNLESSSTGYK